MQERLRLIEKDAQNNLESLNDPRNNILAKILEVSRWTQFPFQCKFNSISLVKLYALDIKYKKLNMYI